MQTIDEQISRALDTGRKIAENKPDYLLISILKFRNEFMCYIDKSFNEELVPYIAISSELPKILTQQIVTILLKENILYKFFWTANIDILKIQKDIVEIAFENWIFMNTDTDLL